MKDTIIASHQRLPAELYVELKDFYARHIKKREAESTDQWLADFDENATMSTNIFDTPAQEVRGAIEANLHTLDNWFTQQGIQRWHLLGNFATTRDEGDTIRAQHYGLLLTKKVPGSTTVHSTSVATDLLQYRGGVWRVLSRHIERDDLPPSSHNYAECNSSDHKGEVSMIRISASERPVGLAEIYYMIEQFYAHQMQILDSGDAAGWAVTFTNNGAFINLSKSEVKGTPSITSGYDELLALAKKSIAGLASEGVTRRHLVSTLTIDKGDGDDVRTRCYVLIVDTCDGATVLRMSFVMEDMLVFSTAGLLVQERTICQN